MEEEYFIYHYRKASNAILLTSPCLEFAIHQSYDGKVIVEESELGITRTINIIL